ncbi:MAG: hypothetical protein RID91_21770 [Azospirillaceae bacterium]
MADPSDSPDLDRLAAEARAGLKSRLLAGFGARGVEIAVQIGQQLVMVSLFIRAWGVGVYEDWLILAAAAMFLSALDFGMQPYFQNLIAMGWARGDKAGVDRIMKVSLGIYATVVVAAIAILGLSTVIVDWPATLRAEAAMTSGEAVVTLMLLCLGALMMIPHGVVHGLYRARGEYARGVMIGTLFNLVTLIAMALALLAGASPVIVAATQLAGWVFGWAITVIDLRRRFEGIHFALALPNRTELIETARKGSLYMVHPMAQNAINNGPVIILGLLAAGPGGVVTYKVSKTLSGLGRQLVMNLSHVTGVEMSRQRAQGDTVALRRLYMNVARVLGGLSGCMAGIVWVAAGPFIGVWTGGEVAHDGLLFGILLVGIMASVPAQAGMSMFHYTNEPLPMTVAYGGWAAIGLGLCFLLIPPMGPAGAALALAIGEFLSVGLYVSHRSSRIIGTPLPVYLGLGYGVTAGAFAVSFGVAQAAAMVLQPEGLVGLIALGVVWGVIAGPPTLFIVTTKTQREWLYATLRDRLARPKNA